MDLSRILLVHNKYIHQGGEESVVASERELLASHGHEVRLLKRDNKAISKNPAKAFCDAFWSRSAYREAAELIEEFRPDIIHVHNFFPQISPSIFWAARKLRKPIVLTLHNYRYGCPGALLFRNGAVCEDCIGRSPLRGAFRRCYRSSFFQSLTAAGSFMLHRALGTFSGKVTCYIALSEFSRGKFMAMGLPPDRLMVKPNFVGMDDQPPDTVRTGGLYVGRLSAEKGLHVLMEALRHVPHASMSIIGSGPAQPVVEASRQVTHMGWRPQDEVYAAMRSASYLVCPSLCYEQFPRILAEAFASGLPVVASRRASLAELIDDGETGLLFTPGSASDLAEKIRWADAHPSEMLRMGRQARRMFEEKYTPARNYEILMDIYAHAAALGPTDAGAHGARKEVLP